MVTDVQFDDLPDAFTPAIALLCVCKAIVADIYTQEESLGFFGDIPEQTMLIVTCGFCSSTAAHVKRTDKTPPTISHHKEGCIVPIAQKAIKATPDNDTILQICRSFLKRQEVAPVLSYFPQEVVIQMAIDKVTAPFNLKISHELLSMLAEYLIGLVTQDDKWAEML